MISIPADLPDSLKTLQDLISLLGDDAAAAKERVTEMQKATSDLRDTINASQTERANFVAAQTEHKRTLDKATAEQAKRLATAQSEFDTECARRKSELDSRAAQLAQLQAKTNSPPASNSTFSPGNDHQQRN